MKTNKLLSIITALSVISGSLLIPIQSVTASEGLREVAEESNNDIVFEEKSNLELVKEKYDLKSITEKDIPDNAKILKFNTVEEAESFISILKENEQNGKMLNLSSILEQTTLKSVQDVTSTESKIIDLSNKKISDDNFITPKIGNDILEKNDETSLMSYETSQKKSKSINGIAKLNARCAVIIDWSSSKGNYVSSVRSITSTFTGITLGSAWSQTGYDANISKDGQTVKALVYGKYDYYLLIDTSLTHLAGEEREYNFTFEF